MTTLEKAGNPLGANKEREFSPEEEGKLRDLASKQVPNIIIARNHYADAKKNPRMFREGQLELAHHEVFDPMHAAWKEQAASNNYQEGAPSQRWRQQRDFLVDWHKNNQDHYPAILDTMHGAHQKGELADKAHVQEEYRKLQHAGIGGGLGQMSASEAGAHFGAKESDDASPTANTVGGADVKFAAQNPEAIKQALSAKRFNDVPQEDIEVPAEKRRAPIKQHPDMDIPENKQLINDFASKYLGILSPGMVDKLKSEVGAQNSEVDDERLRDAATNAMLIAAARHNPQRSVSFHNHVKREMINAIKNDIKAQHTEQVSASAKRAAKQTQQAPAQQGKVTTQDPEHKKKLMAEYQAKLDTEKAAKAQAKTGFENHLYEDRQKRLAAVNAAKLAGGGNQ